MLHLTINGQPCEAPEGATILDALHARGVELPTLCHDERLHPSAACRLCVVAVKGWDRHPTACNTTLLDGMEIETHSQPV